MKTSIVIRSYNEERHIGRLLEGIVSQAVDFDYEIILVDSGSTDGTLEVAEEFPVKVVHIRPGDFSFGYSLNRGIEAGSGEFMVFISAHCYPENGNWLQNMIRPFEENGEIGLVYGKQRGNTVTRYSEHRIFRKWFPDTSIPVQAIPFCNNANAAIRKALWEKVKYDESVTGLEDLAWAREVCEMGYRVSYTAEAGIIHVHNETYRQVCNRYRREAIAYRSIFKEETFGFFTFLRLTVLNVFSDYSHAIGDRVFFKNLFAIPLFRVNQFWGTYNGYRYKDKISPELRQLFYYPVKRERR